MYLPLAVLVLSAQALAFHVALPPRLSDCKASPVTPEPIADLQQFSGDWYSLYLWYNIAEKSNIQNSSFGQCPKLTFAKATLEDIVEQQATCLFINKVDFDYDKVEFVVNIEDRKVLLAKEDEYYLGLYFCSYVGRIQFLKLSDDAFIANSLEGGGSLNLMTRNVPSDEELSCVVENIVGLDGYIGYPFC